MKFPILTYHALSKKKEKDRYTIEVNDFDSHLKFLYENDYTCILVDDYYQSLVNPSIKLPQKSVIITFDDGNDTDFELVLPVLKTYNFKATFFITTDWIGKQGYMRADQLKTLQKEGMSIQSHAKSHSFLDEMDVNNVYQELEQSKNILEDILRKRVSFVSFPGGRYKQQVIYCATKLKYSALFSSVPFYLKRFDDIYLIGRYGIKYTSEKKNNFDKCINITPFGKIMVQIEHNGKDFLKKVLGNNIYYFFWKKYINR